MACTAADEQMMFFPGVASFTFIRKYMTVRCAAKVLVLVLALVLEHVNDFCPGWGRGVLCIERSLNKKGDTYPSPMQNHHPGLCRVSTKRPLVYVYYERGRTQVYMVKK